MKHKNTNIDNLFKGLQGKWDVAHPHAGHRERFLAKIKSVDTQARPVAKNSRGWWKPLVVAASITLLVGFFVGRAFDTSDQQLSQIAPEMLETQVYFTALIDQELVKIAAESNIDTEKIIEDAMIQLKKLELDYEILKQDLLTNGSDRRVIQAMINNFQTRITLLNRVLEQIDEVKLHKQNSDENNIV